MIGDLIEHYRIQEVVGCGGMGVVYRALDENLERTVAVKVLGAEFREDREFVERFRQEARVQAALNHPNIATLFDFFIWNALPVAVMEFIEGETLRSMVDRCGPIPAHVALPIFIQALRGVAAGHKRGIIHRDLKPGNLMITHEGIVKVTDFGIAKVQSSTGLTQASTRVGSASYMAPEQILGRPVDVRTDIYVMGGTLYELLCGRPPFRAGSQFEIESAHVRDPPEPPTAYYPHIPPAAVQAVMRALAKEPSERFATAEEFMQALPDLHGVPYVAPGVPIPNSSSAATLSEMLPALPDLHGAPYVASEPAIPNSSSAAALSKTRTTLPGRHDVPHVAAEPAIRSSSSAAELSETRTTLPGRHDAPYVVAEPAIPTSSSAAELSETRTTLPGRHDAPYVASEPAIPTSSSAGALSETRPLRQSAPKTARTRRAATAIGVGSLLVTLSVVSVVRYAARQAPIGPDHGHSSQLVPVERPAPTGRTQVAALPESAVAGQPNTAATAPSNTAATAPSDTAATAPPQAAVAALPDTAVTPPQTMGPKPAEPPPPAPESTPASSSPPASAPSSQPASASVPSRALNGTRNLTGMWTGAYLDGSGRAQLEVVNLQMRQVTDGAITGRFTYKAASTAGEECTLEKSTYSTQSKRLRLIVHCRNPSHPKYLNVPLEFTDVDPRASSLKGGRLAFHLADDIVVMLKRTKGV